MNDDSNPVERARHRFFGALDALEAAARRRKEIDRGTGALEAELRTLGEDRSRLAQQLDRSQARAVKLETVVGDVSARLDTAIGTIRGLLEPADPRAGPGPRPGGPESAG